MANVHFTYKTFGVASKNFYEGRGGGYWVKDPKLNNTVSERPPTSSKMFNFQLYMQFILGKV